MNSTTITLDDGRVFPVYEGQAIAWAFDNCAAEQQKGYPKMRAVIRAMKEHRPEQLQHERRELLKASFDRLFGHVAKQMLAVIDEELSEAPQEDAAPHERAAAA